MPNKIITTRDQLLVYIAGHIAYKHIAKAMHEGEVENLGAFDIRGNRGWIVRVQTLLAKQNFYIGVSVMDGKYRLLLTRVEPGWKYWSGDKSKNEVYRGDDPDRYAQLREKELDNG